RRHDGRVRGPSGVPWRPVAAPTDPSCGPPGCAASAPRTARTLAPESIMKRDSLDSVLERLCHGDPAAAERAFRGSEAYLRMVVRKKLPVHLRAKFDSRDVVQSVWADVLRGFQQGAWCFPDEAHLRAFLVKLTRHRFIDQLRRNRMALTRERPL